jgi:hypothetical protein
VPCPTITVAVFVLPSYLLPQFTVVRAREGCEKDCLTLATVVSNSNEDSEQRQTKVHWEDIAGRRGEKHHMFRTKR